MAIVGEDEREGLAERGRDARRAEPGAHNFVDQHPHVLVGERLEGLRETARDLARDAPAVLRVGEPPSGPLGGPHRPQVGRDDFARQEVILHERAQDPPDPLLARGDRKSTRLNSSHTVISYAVFCLKKKTAIASHTTWSWCAARAMKA